MTTNQCTRRQFLKQSAVAGMPLILSSSARGANDQIRVGVIGTGVRGKYLIGNMPGDARVVALCDCYQANMADTRQPKGKFADILGQFREGDAKNVSTFQDYRRMLDRAKLDAVVIAAPDHHHALAGILACQAGLDVYLEKPLTVTIAEGRRLAEAVSRYRRILQVGSQQRTMEMNRFGCEFVRKGGIGKISHVDLPNYPGPMPYEGLPEEAVPKGLDWDLYCGPTETRPHNRKLWVKDAFKVGKLVWRGWDLYRSYSGHLMTNWGAHSIDMVQFALGMDDGGPVNIQVNTKANVAELAREWAAKTPPLHAAAKDRQADACRFFPVTMRYANGVELRFRPGVGLIVFHGDKGKLMMRRNHFQVDPPDLVKDVPDPSVVKKWAGAGHVAKPHLENWLSSIRTRKQPNAPVEVGHRTASICHLANIARQLSRPLRWDPMVEQFVDDQEANRLLDRPRRKGYELPKIAPKMR